MREYRNMRWQKWFNYFVVSCLFTMLTNTITAQNQRYYWVGGGGDNNWGTFTNWSFTSGGTPAGITNSPANGNTVVFDQNSFLNADTLIVINGAVQCDSLIVQNCTKMPYFDFGNTNDNSITINGSMFLQKGTIFAKVGGNGTCLTFRCRTYQYLSYACFYLRFTSSRLQETISTDSVFTAFRTIEFSGNNSTVWKISNNTQFNHLNIQSGTLDLNGKNIDASTVSISGTGKISFANSTITCSYHWINSSANNITAMQSANSLIRIGYDFSGGNKGNIYYNLEFNGNNVLQSISNGICNKVNVLNSSAEISYITTDTLLLQGSSASIDSVRVNNYLSAKPLGCGGNIRLFGSKNCNLSLLTLGGSATVDIQNALIYDLAVSKPITASKSYDWGNNINIGFTAPDAGRDLYWTGGTGNWDEPAHWRLSNNSPANCIPTLADNVFFDNTSSGGRFDVNVKLPDAYCNSMTWSNVPATSNLYIGGNNALYIDGSLCLSETMSLLGENNSRCRNNSFIYFTSNQTNNAIIPNKQGIGAHIIYFQSVSGNGKWMILDSLQTGVIYFNRGHLDLNGYNVTASFFRADANEANSGFTCRSPLRSIDFHNSTITLTGNHNHNAGVAEWTYIGGQQIAPIHSANSLIRMINSNNSSNFVSKGNDYYYNVEHSGGSNSNTCAGVGDTSYFNKITFHTIGSINVNSTTASKIYPDSLLLLGNGTYTINSDLNVRKYLGTSLECGGNTTIKSNNSTVKTIYMDTVNPKSDRVKVRNTSITDVSITNGNYDVIDCNISPNSKGWNNINNPPVTYYWVGGTGNWSDTLHWAITSGGNSSGCIPRSVDNVIFDNNSGGVGYRVTVDILAYCDSMLWIGNDSLRPVFYMSPGLSVTINGSLELQRNMICSGNNTNSPRIIFVSNRSNETIKTNGVTIVFALSFNGTGGWKLLDSLKVLLSLYCPVDYVKGTLNFNGQYVEMDRIGVSGNRNDRFLNIKNSEIHSHCDNGAGGWTYTGDLLADSSVIYCAYMQAEQTLQYTAQYYDIVLNNTNNTATITNGKYNKVSVLSLANITRIETDTLVLSAAINYVYSFQDTIRVNKGYYGVGTPCVQIYLQSRNETSPAIFDIKTACANFPNDTLLMEYVYVHGIKALTGVSNAKLKKGSLSPDIDKAGASWGYGIGTDNYNQNWAAMLPYNSGGSTYFGEDKIVSCNGFPDTLYSNSFLPSYGAIFQWRKDSLNTPIIASTPNYTVTESGTYYLTVNYGNNCMVTDNINFIGILTDSIHETICYGKTYSGWNFKDLNTAGFYTSRYTTSTGCDSLIYLTLSILPKVDTTFSIYDTICKGDSLLFCGKYYKQAGIYTDKLQTIYGCDSVVTLRLYVALPKSTSIYDTICQGDSVLFGGQYRKKTNLYMDTLLTVHGCDSIVTLQLLVKPSSETVIYDTICTAHLPYRLYGFNVSAGGDYRRVRRNSVGCDSIITLHLTVYDTIYKDIVATICDGEIYTENGFEETQAGIHTRMEKAEDGCNVLVRLDLTVNPMPIAAFEANPQTVLFGEEIQFTDKSVSQYGNLTYWYWNFGDGENSSLQNPVHAYTVLGYMPVSLLVENEFGCSDSISHEVLILKPLNFPNIYTPIGSNGERYVFRPLEDGGFFEEFTIIIYNRWGMEVWKKSCKGENCPDYDDAFWWNGTTQWGEQVVSGVYYWVVYARYPAANIKPLVKNGSVTVVK